MSITLSFTIIIQVISVTNQAVSHWKADIQLSYVCLCRFLPGRLLCYAALIACSKEGYGQEDIQTYIVYSYFKGLKLSKRAKHTYTPLLSIYYSNLIII